MIASRRIRPLQFGVDERLVVVDKTCTWAVRTKKEAALGVRKTVVDEKLRTCLARLRMKDCKAFTVTHWPVHVELASIRDMNQRNWGNDGALFKRP